jgi:hypothetical protein
MSHAKRVSMLPECGRSRHEWNSDQRGGCGCRFARDANAVSPVLLARLSQVLSAACHRSPCLPALLALEPGDRELTALG